VAKRKVQKIEPVTDLDNLPEKLNEVIDMVNKLVSNIVLLAEGQKIIAETFEQVALRSELLREQQQPPGA